MVRTLYTHGRQRKGNKETETRKHATWGVVVLACMRDQMHENSKLKAMKNLPSFYVPPTCTKKSFLCFFPQFGASSGENRYSYSSLDPWPDLWCTKALISRGRS